MNCAKVLTSLAVRAFSTRRSIGRKYSNPGVQKRLGLLQNGNQAESELLHELNELEDDFEPDFSQAQKSYSEHKKELMVNKEKLKRRIVARKYFKQTAPSFLTFIEREQIRFLHENDPTEWTPEKLSESFPVLPDVVRKILKAKWLPKSTDVVMNHDRRVVENWKKFKSGELPLEPRLKLHLQKFKDREVALPCGEELAQKIIPPPFEFPKPRSTFFSSIVQRRAEEGEIERTSDATKQIAANDDDANLTSGESGEATRADLSVTKRLMLSKREKKATVLEGDESSKRSGENDSFVMNGDGKNKKSWSKAGEDLVTLDKYMEDTLENMNGKATEAEKVFVVAYKKRNEVERVEMEANCEPDEIVLQKRERDCQSEAQTEEDRAMALQMSRVAEDTDDKRLATCVKEWRKSTEEQPDEDYPSYIEIPEKKYKEGMTYRLGDCYYDDDGEFLYRVPGVKN